MPTTRKCPVVSEKLVPQLREGASSSGTQPPPLGLSELHVVSMFTPGICGLLACWQQRVFALQNSAGLLGLANVSVHFHIGYHPLPGANASTTPPRFKDPAWIKAVRERINYLRHVLKRYEHRSERALFLFTDLDVWPLRPLAPLLRPLQHALRASALQRERIEQCARNGHCAGVAANLQPRPLDIIFMREPPGHCGMSAWLANTGLMVMRNTLAVRKFLFACYSTRGRGVFEQDVANLLLIKKLRPQELAWGLVDSALVTASLDEIGAQTVAFHAVGVSGTRAKADVLERARSLFDSSFDSGTAATGAAGEAASSPHVKHRSPRPWCANRTRVSVPQSWRDADGWNGVPRVLMC